jgi:hypothetical protein
MVSKSYLLLTEEKKITSCVFSLSLCIRVNNCVGENNQKYFVLFTVSYKIINRKLPLRILKLILRVP